VKRDGLISPTVIGVLRIPLSAFPLKRIRSGVAGADFPEVPIKRSGIALGRTETNVRLNLDQGIKSQDQDQERQEVDCAFRGSDKRECISRFPRVFKRVHTRIARSAE